MWYSYFWTIWEHLHQKFYYSRVKYCNHNLKIETDIKDVWVMKVNSVAFADYLIALNTNNNLNHAYLKKPLTWDTEKFLIFMEYLKTKQSTNYSTRNIWKKNPGVKWAFESILKESLKKNQIISNSMKQGNLVIQKMYLLIWNYQMRKLKKYSRQ